MTRTEKIRRWGRALAKAGVWFGAAFVVTAYLRDGLTAHPIIVHTNSIDTGVYWLDLQPRSLTRGQYVTFDFEPSTPLLKANFAPTRHTKILLGLPGDFVRTDKTGAIQVCEPTVAQQHGLLAVGKAKHVCRDAGVPREIDSKGRPLIAWLKAGEEYRLGPSEYWVYAPNPKSLDSRYNGPIDKTLIKGTARPLWSWRSWKD